MSEKNWEVPFLHKQHQYSYMIIYNLKVVTESMSYAEFSEVVGPNAKRCNDHHVLLLTYGPDSVVASK